MRQERKVNERKVMNNEVTKNECAYVQESTWLDTERARIQEGKKELEGQEERYKKEET